MRPTLRSSLLSIVFAAFGTACGTDGLTDPTPAAGPTPTEASWAVLSSPVTVTTLQTSKRSLHFLPAQILVREGRSYAEIPYPACSVTVQPTNFIESGRVPQDSQFVAWTLASMSFSFGSVMNFS